MAFVANIGTPDTTRNPNAYAPPAVAGFYKVRIGEPKMSPVKSAPEVEMLRIPVRVISTVDGQKASGFAEALIFNIPAEHAATYGEKYNITAQQGRFRNLLEKAIAPEQSDALKSRTNVTVDPAQWKDIEAYVRIDLKEDEYNGERRMRGVVSYWMTKDEAEAKLSGKKPTGIAVVDEPALTPEDEPLTAAGDDDGQLDLIPKNKTAKKSA
ncbi:MAG: hypothetical protein EBU84_02455 [Actinobacteria bacterium]|jgi:hypothetical protein|nr:hypothetical protein [Actinomycetota bacterium]